MSDLYLDPKNKAAIVDFLVEAMEYADTAHARKTQTAVTAYQDGAKQPVEELYSLALELGRATWPARYAVARFFREDGVTEEWDRVLKTVRPSTAHLLKRFAADLGSKDLDKVLAHAESDVALHDEERFEIAETRRHLRSEYWHSHALKLKALVQDGQNLLDGYEERFSALRELAAALPGSLDEILSKVARYQDRVLFEGEAVPTDILDQEIAYYIDQKEISPE